MVIIFICINGNIYEQNDTKHDGHVNNVTAQGYKCRYTSTQSLLKFIIKARNRKLNSAQRQSCEIKFFSNSLKIKRKK